MIEFFLCREYNADKAFEAMKQSFNVTITKVTIYKIYKVFRNIIYKYILIVYQTEPLGELNERSFFSIDESLFSHQNTKQLWIKGL